MIKKLWFLASPHNEPDLPIITTKKREILTVSLYESDGKVSYAYFTIQGGYKEVEMIKILLVWGPSP